MSKRGIDAPLAEQMDRLKKTMYNRDKRRDQDREKRMVSKAADDPYAQANLARPATGGVSLGPGAAAQAAVLNAAALEGPSLLRCELCQADFRNEAMLRQHMEGAPHKKAVAKEKAQKEREAWMGNPSAAANALQAAAWLNGGEMRNREPNYRPPQREALPGRGRGRGRGAAEPKPPPPAAAKPKGPSHAQLIAQARKANEPISIDGWIPPPLDFSAASEPQETTEEVEGAETKTEANAKEEESSEGIKKEEVKKEEDLGLKEDAEDDDLQVQGGLGLVAYGTSGSSEGEDDSEESDNDAPSRPAVLSFF